MNSGIFDCNQLVQCYAPPDLRSVMPGNRVMLRSGGPEMTVADVSHDDSVLCQWMLDDGKLETHSFPLHILTCYGAR